MQTHKAPDPSAPFRPTITAYEAELDQLLPASRPRGGWRKGEPFAAEPPQTIRRVKWLLSRRSNLLAGRDWPVEIVTPDPRAPRKCFAVPQEPIAVEGVDDPRNPASPLAAPVWSPPPAAPLALALRVPLATVERALTVLPDTHRTDEGVSAWVRQFAASEVSS